MAAAAAVVDVRKRACRFACYLNNENSAIAAQLGEVIATKTQQARETGVRVVWPAAGRDGGGRRRRQQHNRRALSRLHLASRVPFSPPPAHKGASAESRVLRYVPPALENTIKERNGRASHRGVGAQPVAVVRTTQGIRGDRTFPGHGRGATRLAGSTRHTNMSERALPRFLGRTSPRLRTARNKTAKPAQAARRATTRRRRASRPVRGTRPTRENTRWHVLELPG